MEFFEQAAAFRREGRPFAVATVVARRAPVSAHLGDRAIVFVDGQMEGFVGGACSHEIIRRQALEVLRSRRARLVSIRPDASHLDELPEHVTVAMTCASEGAIDVYVEPFLPAPRLIVAGATPAASALVRLAHNMDYEVVRAVQLRERRDVEADVAVPGVSVVALETLAPVVDEGVSRGLEQSAVVASQGHYDEEALEILLTRPLFYIGLVASRRRAGMITAYLKEQGISGLTALRNPAGLDLGARTPIEVALSILAEIVQVRTANAPAHADPPRAAATAVDPVCGMDVDIANAHYTADVDGRTYYFCCPICQSHFVRNPQQFRVQA
jgi:xanthine dehydrogenase accessory factor